ncbi:MAG TPA: type IX secretion system outer membrane channel protein PorV [Bacteroidia bacterium]|nr:type IX secretion system outer membrane channel protein PorV [Bacteroidia bacterium]
MIKKLIAGGLLVLLAAPVFAQGQFTNRTVITTTVPFLLISTDARSGAMGDAGVALTPDANATHWNPSKFAFVKDRGGVSTSITPWLRQLVNDVNFAYLSGYGRINKRSTFAASLRYFSLGQINFTDIQGNSLGTFNPNEFAVDGSYATQLSRYFSIGVSLRFIYSNLTGGLQGSGATANAGTAGAGDISAYYTRSTKVEGKKLDYAFGANISNIGNKITYTTTAHRQFIPTNLKIGGYANYYADEHNEIGFLLDFNKLLIPSNPEYQRDSTGRAVLGANGQPVILKGRDPNVPVIQGIMQSFYDAPNGFREELQEINISAGFEYWYDKTFAARAGFFYEHPDKGDRKYLTFGLGIRYKLFGVDAAYLAPIQRRHPLQNTLRFTLHFNLDAFKSSENQQ